VVDGVKARLAVGAVKAIREESRRAGMFLGRARPEDAVFAVDSVVCDARVIRDAAGSGATKLVEHSFGGSECELLSEAEPFRQFVQDFEVVLHTRRRRLHATTADHATFQIRERAVFFRPLCHRQHDVGEFRRFVQERIAHHEEFQRTKPLEDVPGVRRRDRDVRAHDEQAVDAVGPAERIEQFVCTPAFSRQ
jgi:hypothetical protein